MTDPEAISVPTPEPHRAPPATLGRRFGLGRQSLPTPREHCRRCGEITERADQVIMNYIMANGRQVEIINRLLKDPDATKEIVALGQLLAEKDSLITHLYGLAVGQPGLVDRQDIKDAVDNYRQEVTDATGERDAGSAGQATPEGS